MSRDRRTGRGLANLQSSGDRQEDRSESARKRRLYREDVMPERLAAKLELACAPRHYQSRPRGFGQLHPFDRGGKQGGRSRPPGGIPEDDYAPGRLARNRLLAEQAFADHQRTSRTARCTRLPPSGLLDQDAAADARRWYNRALERLVRRHRRRLRRRGIRAFTIFLTVVTPSGAYATLGQSDLDKLRAKFQRYARSLPANSFFAGMLEADYIIDSWRKVDLWQWHGHFIVVVPSATRAAAKQIVREAFPVRRDPALGVLAPVRMKIVTRKDGGLEGAIRYTSKGLQIHAVHRKWIGVNPATGRRAKAQKQALTRGQRAIWAGLAFTVRPEQLMVWSGYRRYGDHLKATSSHGGGGHRRCKV